MERMSLPHILLGDSVAFALDYKVPCIDQISPSLAVEYRSSRHLLMEASDIVAKALDTMISLRCVSTDKLFAINF